MIRAAILILNCWAPVRGVDILMGLCYFGNGNSKNRAKMELAIPKIEQKRDCTFQEG